MTENDIQAERYREYLEYYDASTEPPMTRWLFDLVTVGARNEALKRGNHERD
jgi:hypothetical protein